MSEHSVVGQDNRHTNHANRPIIQSNNAAATVGSEHDAADICGAILSIAYLSVVDHTSSAQVSEHSIVDSAPDASTEPGVDIGSDDGVHGAYDINSSIQHTESHDLNFEANVGTLSDHSPSNIKEAFSATRVDPVIEAAAALLGLVFNDDSQKSDETTSLPHGKIGLGRSEANPILRLPADTTRDKEIPV